MTLEEVKKRILDCGGKVVENNDFRELLNGKYYRENLLSATRILYDFSEEEMPDEYYDSSYHISGEYDKTEACIEEKIAYAKELIIFLGSKDRKNLDYFYYICPCVNNVEKVINLVRKIKGDI